VREGILSTETSQRLVHQQQQKPACEQDAANLPTDGVTCLIQALENEDRNQATQRTVAAAAPELRSCRHRVRQSQASVTLRSAAMAVSTRGSTTEDDHRVHSTLVTQTIAVRRALPLRIIKQGGQGRKHALPARTDETDKCTVHRCCAAA